MSRPYAAVAALALLGFQLAGALAQDREAAIPLGNGLELKVVRVEPGAFTQGSPAGEQGRGEFEDQRQVTISRPFYLGKSPITRGQFAQFVKESGFRTEAEKGTSGGFGWSGAALVQRSDFNWKNPGFAQTDNDPVVLVTWDDAKAFLSWLSRKAGAAFDLPTEAQWEYACRAGSQAAFSSGDDANAAGEMAWHKGHSGNRTHPVGEKGENAWGFTDMHGNVWEWCQDWYGPYAAGAATNPVQTNSSLSDKPRRVLRGGSWLKEITFARSAARYRNDPKSRNADNGFRVMAYQLKPAVALERTSPPSESREIPAPEPPAVSLERQNSTPRNLAGPASSSTSVPAPVAQNVSRLGTLLGGLCCVLGAGAIILLLARWIFKRGGIGSATSGTPVIPPVIPPGTGGTGAGGLRRPGTFRTRMGDDGFWIDAADVAAGTLLTCRYTAGGATQQIDVRYQPQPGGQFIYTGVRPSTVSIVSSLPGGMGSGAFVGPEPFLDLDEDRRREAERQRSLADEEERRRRRRVDPPAY